MKFWNKAFSIAEVIVVVIIIAILSAISFMWFQRYGVYSRDSVRLSDLNGLEKSLELQLTQTWELPYPDDYIEISSSGTLISYQWDAGEELLRTLWLKKWWVDPLDGSYYTYLVNKDLDEYQVLGLLEGSSNVAYYPYQTFADNSARTPVTKWYPLWVLIDKEDNQPSHRKKQDIDIKSSLVSRKAIFDIKNIVSGTGAELQEVFTVSNLSQKQRKYYLKNLIPEDGLVLYYDMESSTRNGYVRDRSWEWNHWLPQWGFEVGKYDGTVWKAVFFDGSNDYIALPISYGESELSEVSICVWLKSRSTNDQFIMSFDRSEVFRFSLRSDGSGGEDLAWDTQASSLNDFRPQWSFTDWNWHYICAIFDNDVNPTKKIYVDGVLLASQQAHSWESLWEGQERSRSYWFIATWSEAGYMNGTNAPEAYFHWFMDELRMYERALNEEEIKNLYRYTSPDQ